MRTVLFVAVALLVGCAQGGTVSSANDGENDNGPGGLARVPHQDGNGNDISIGNVTYGACQ